MPKKRGFSHRKHTAQPRTFEDHCNRGPGAGTTAYKAISKQRERLLNDDPPPTSSSEQCVEDGAAMLLNLSQQADDKLADADLVAALPADDRKQLQQAVQRLLRPHQPQSGQAGGLQRSSSGNKAVTDLLDTLRKLAQQLQQTKEEADEKIAGLEQDVADAISWWVTAEDMLKELQQEDAELKETIEEMAADSVELQQQLTDTKRQLTREKAKPKLPQGRNKPIKERARRARVRESLEAFRKSNPGDSDLQAVLAEMVLREKGALEEVLRRGRVFEKLECELRLLRRRQQKDPAEAAQFEAARVEAGPSRQQAMDFIDLLTLDDDGELMEEQLGELTVPLKSRPTRYALARFLSSVELPPSVSIAQLVAEDELDAVDCSSSDNDEMAGQLFSLRESLQQLLDLLLPPADADEWHAVHARFKEYWRWSRSDTASAAGPADELDMFDEPQQPTSEEESELKQKAEQEHEEIVLLFAGDGFPITENPRKSLTVLRFGLGNLRVLQQSCDAWPLLGIIDAEESNPVVRLALRWFEPQILDLRTNGIRVHGVQYRVRCKAVGDLKWRSEQLKGQLGHAFTHFDSNIPAVTIANKLYLHALGLSEPSLNTYAKRIEAKREFDEVFEHDRKRLPKAVSEKDEHKLKLDVLKRLKHAQIDWPLLLCDDDLPDSLHRLLRLGEQLLQDLMIEAQSRAERQPTGADGQKCQRTCMQSLADALESKEFQAAFAKVAKKLRADTLPEKANMIGRQAQALIRHAHLLIDSLQFAGQTEQDRKRHAVFSCRAKLLFQLLPLWLQVELTDADVEQMTELSLLLYTLHRLYLEASQITPMLVDATWITPLKTAAFLKETGLSAAVGSTQGAEAGNKQIKHRYHHCSNKNQASVHRNYRLQLARMELIVRRGRILSKLQEAVSAKEAANSGAACSCGRGQEVDSDLCWVCNSPAVAAVELAIERASKQKTFTRSSAQDQETAFVDDRDFDFTGGESDDEREQDHATSGPVSVAPAHAESASAAPSARQAGKRKAASEAPADHSPPNSKSSKAEARTTAATASRAAPVDERQTAARPRSMRKIVANL